MNKDRGIYSPQLWINGQEREGSGSKIEVLNPSTGKPASCFKSAQARDIDDAFQSARTAQPFWEELGFENRWRLIEKWKDNLLKHKETLLELLEIETGKAPWDAQSELKAFFNKWALTFEAYFELLKEKKTTQESWGYRSLGVFAVLGPFNFPLHLPGGQILPALATGGSVVFKPSELTSSVSHFYVKCAHKAGIPHGVLNLVLGAGDVGESLVKHPELDAVLFTGSSKVGLSIYQSLAHSPHKLVALEMGGCNAMVISDIENTQAAISQMILSSFISSGQRCSCTRRMIFIQNPRLEKLLAGFIEKAKKIRVASYDDNQIPFMGPLIRPKAKDEVLDFQKRLVSRGGKVLLEAKALSMPGHWISPGIIEMPKDRLINDEECFGPIVQVCIAENLDEAIALANQTSMGLTASLISDHSHEFEKFQKKIRAGVINWNEPTTGASSKLPFGGVKGSGNHRPSGYTMIESCVWPVASKTCAQLCPVELKGLED